MHVAPNYAYWRQSGNEWNAEYDRRKNRHAFYHLAEAMLTDHVQHHAPCRVLEFGCGTGLCGVLLRSSSKNLVGVDLSPGMLDKARARSIYDELVEGELCAFMRSRPAAFDIVNCADTLCYFGALEEAMAAARACLRPGGVFAFTLEAEPPDSEHRHRIQAHGRYAHRADYVTDVARAAA